MEDIIMKKTYMTPAAEVVRIEKALLTSTSNVQLNTTKEVSDTNGLLGREFDFTDDED